MTKLGAYVGFPDMYNASTQARTKAEWDSITSAMGKAPSMMLQYVDKEHPRSQWVQDQEWVIGSWQRSPWLANVTPVVGLPMAVSKSSALSDFNAIAAGQWDSTIRGILKSWVDAGYTNIYLRPGWEMNGDWYAWGITSANASSFAAAFKHIADVAHSYPGANVKVVWNPNVGDPNPQHVPFANYYPGDSAVDVIGIDSYGAPIDSDTSPDDNPSSAADFTLRAAIDFAREHGKAFAIPETGGANVAFPQNLAAEIAARGVPVDFVGIWTLGDEYGWENGPGDTAAWRAAYDKINAVTGGTNPNPNPNPDPPPPPPPTPPSDIVERQTLSLSLTGDWFNGDPQFVAYIDGQRVGAGTVYRDHGREQPQTFNFSRDLTVGKHEVRIDFINDAYRAGRNGGDRNLYVEQVRFAGDRYLTNTEALYSNGSLTIAVDSAR